MPFLKKQPKQYFTLFEQLLSSKNIPRLYDQHVFFINRRMQNLHFFNIVSESPSQWKHWNKSIGLIHLTKHKRIPFQSYTVLQPYPLTIPVWRLALTFIFHLAKKRKSYFLFSGNHEMFSLSYLFDEILTKKYNLNLAKAIDFWVPGFIGNRQSMILPVRSIIAYTPKSVSPWKLRAKTFSRKFRFKHKAYLKNLDTYRFLRDVFYPECIILLNTTKRAYAAGQEGYRKKLPTIALASSDSTNFGFSGSHFVLPAATHLIEHLHYYCFLFFIVLSFAKQQFTLQEQYKLGATQTANVAFSDQYLNLTSVGYFKFSKLIRHYTKLLKISEDIIFETIVIPFAEKIKKEKSKKLTSKNTLFFKIFQTEIDSFMSLPTKFKENLEGVEIDLFDRLYHRLTRNRIGQETYVPPTAQEKKVFFQVAKKKSHVVIYQTLKKFLSTFILQTIFFKSGCVLLNENNITPITLYKKNSLYSFTEKLVRLLIKKPGLFDISLKEIDWQFYTESYNQLLKSSPNSSSVYKIKKEIKDRTKDQKLGLKINWEEFSKIRPSIPSFLNRKLLFYKKMSNYSEQTKQIVMQQIKTRLENNKIKDKNKQKHMFKNFKKSLLFDVYNSEKILRNVPFLKKFTPFFGFLGLGIDPKKILKQKKKRENSKTSKNKQSFISNSNKTFQKTSKYKINT